MLSIVTDIDGRTRQHTIILSALHDKLAEPVQKIADNTKDVANTLKELKNENRELTGIAAGKKQVPLSVMIILVLIIGTLWLLDRATRGLHIQASPTGGLKFDYEQLDHPNK